MVNTADIDLKMRPVFRDNCPRVIAADLRKEELSILRHLSIQAPRGAVNQKEPSLIVVSSRH
jgi:hypothetical protein